MSHDKIRAAARKRMAETGEPARSARSVRGTIGVHGGRGRWLMNGSYNGLVELAIEPPCYTSRQPSTLFLRSKVSSLTISLIDPDGFIAAVEGK